MASGVLGNEAIYKAHRAKQIVIEPFDHENLAPCAYDFRLGRYFYRQVQARKDLPANGGLAVDLWDEADARLLWEEAQVRRACRPGAFCSRRRTARAVCLFGRK